MCTKGSSGKDTFASLLIRWRGWLTGLVAVLAVISALLLPYVRINADVTRYLPDDSPMRKGLSILERDFPGMDIRMQILRVLFLDEAPSDTLQLALTELLSDSRQIEVRENGNHTLYQYYLPKDADGESVKQTVVNRFGDRVKVEIEDNSGMPEGVPLMIGAGFFLIILVLVLMSPSYVGVLLYIITFGLAILINLGTNALLPSVSVITNALSAVMQTALSIDYAVILMNRYRQERCRDVPTDRAMVSALSQAMPSILCSSFTTIVSLMMLCFMRLKIGADLGIVLSKGVLCSLLVSILALPALILAFDKAIIATQKRVPEIRVGGLARFEWRHRVQLVCVFVALLVGAWFLHRHTGMYYSLTRLSPITREFPDRNRMLVLYPTAEEEALIPLVDEVVLSPGISCISYPSIAMKPRTAADLVALAPDLTEHIPPQLVDLIYYAATHPERTERMRLEDLEPTARSLMGLAGSVLPNASLGDLSSRFNLDLLFPEPAAPGIPADTLPSSSVDTVRMVPVPAVHPAGHTDSLSLDPEPDTVLTETAVIPPANILDRMGVDYSYEQLTLPRTEKEMEAYLPIDGQYVRIVYRLAGIGRRGHPDKMNALEFMEVVQEKILNNKRYASRIPPSSAQMLQEVQQLVGQVVEAGPVRDTIPVRDTVMIANLLPAEDSLLVAAAIPEVPDEPAVPMDTLKEVSPVEQLIDLALSGRKCSASQCYRTLRRAGVSVRREEIDLLYLYYGFQTARDTVPSLSLLELEGFLERLQENPLVRQYLDSARVAQLNGLRQTVSEDLGQLRGNKWSLAVITSDLPEEGEATFSFIEKLRRLCGESFSGESLLVGYSVMYHEMKEGFSRELLILTLLTVLAIFFIVAITFRSAVIPFILVSTVMTAVWLDVAASGVNGPMLYISYLMLQSILMGSTIDYSILFTHYYREGRRSSDIPASLLSAYRGAIHTILTSGTILVLGTFVMSLMIKDPIIVPVIRCVSLGALIAIILILFFLPAVIGLLDRWVKK